MVVDLSAREVAELSQSEHVHVCAREQEQVHAHSRPLELRGQFLVEGILRFEKVVRSPLQLSGAVHLRNVGLEYQEFAYTAHGD